MGTFGLFSSHDSASSISGLSIKTEQTNNEVTLKLSGRLDASQVTKLVSSLNTIKQNIRLDLAGVNFVDVRGLSALFAQKQKSAQDQYEFSMTNVQDSVRLIFEITKLDQVFLAQEAQHASFNFAAFLHSNENFVMA